MFKVVFFALLRFSQINSLKSRTPYQLATFIVLLALFKLTSSNIELIRTEIQIRTKIDYLLHSSFDLVQLVLWNCFLEKQLLGLLLIILLQPDFFDPYLIFYLSFVELFQMFLTHRLVFFVLEIHDDEFFDLNKLHIQDLVQSVLWIGEYSCEVIIGQQVRWLLYSFGLDFDTEPSTAILLHEKLSKYFADLNLLLLLVHFAQLLQIVPNIITSDVSWLLISIYWLIILSKLVW